MNITLWVLQVLLALVFLAHGVLFLMAAFLAHGRWRRLPIAPRPR